MRVAPIVLALALLAARVAPAQVVTGRIVEAGGDVPLGSAVVALVDSAQRRLQATLSDSVGRFTLRAPGPGQYALHAERVGSTSATTAALVLRAGDSLDVRVALSPAQRLAAVRVTARERCRVRPADGEVAARLWDEARKALVGTTLGQAQGASATRLAHFTRAIDGSTRRLERERWRLLPRGRQLYRGPDADELEAHGFVHRVTTEHGSDSTTYLAPDAEVLLSDAFLASHCLRAVSPPSARAGQLGLAFEPVPRRGARRADVRGTLWIDTTTFELHDFDFTYTDLPPGLPSGPAGGRVIFARLADGTWYIDHWVVTMPGVRRITYARSAGAALYAPGARSPIDTGIVEYVAEEGGRSIVPEARRRALGWASTIAGSLVDSADGARPIVGARIAVVGTPYEAVTDDDGAFYLEVPLVGVFPLAVSTPRATSLGLSWDSSLRLGIGRQLRVEAAVPRAATLRQLHCGDAVPTTAPLLIGLVQTWRAVRDAEPVLAAVAGVPVEVEWRLREWPADWRERRTVRSDDQGRFRLCALPSGAEFVVRASRGGARSEGWQGQADDGAVLTRDLVLFPTRGARD